MVNFFKDLEHDRALEIERLSRLTFELRENRNAVLAPYGLVHEAALLDRITSGAVPEHPAYEHYLAARILDETRESARMLLSERLRGARRS